MEVSAEPHIVTIDEIRAAAERIRGVATRTRLLNVRAVICMPREAPRVKIDGVRADGAEIQFTGTDSEERHELALRLVEERGLVMVEPYDDPAIIAGPGTCGL